MNYQKMIDKLTDKDIMHLSTHRIPTYKEDGKYNPEFIEYLLRKEGKMND